MIKVILIAAQTLNGYIAHDAAEPATWTSKEDKRFFVSETKKHRALILGRVTYDTIGRPLPGRLNVVLTRHPEKEKNQEGIVEFTDQTPRKLIAELERRGFASVVVAGGASVYGQFLQAGLLDELLITIEPKIFSTGVNLVSALTKDITLKLIAVKTLNPDTVLMHYKVVGR